MEHGDQKLRIEFCMGSSCFARGNNQSLRVLQDYVSQHSLSGMVDLSGALCHGRCKEGPNVIIGETSHTRVSPGTIIDLMKHHLGKRFPANVEEK
ncbi:MAG: (2Fe-2S) ferredoxin domain-containing protein [Phycisphaerales bacterium]|jgi:NADH:ubiquinone oxidoreductase subunit E|nr:(2Fe-2S) ferredoxin domain-containing protein [Phycisphaerales bacterium]